MPLRSSTKAPKSDDLDDLPLAEHVADLHRAHHLVDVLPRRRGGVAGAVDAHRAVLLDVDLDGELVLDAADRLAALADQQADLVGSDLRLEHLRRVRRHLGAGLGDGRVHDLEDPQPGVAGLGQRRPHDLLGRAGDLDVHLQGGDAVGACRRP